jgi:patatin-like phospholipase/acyl hydrolase
MVKKILSIDGGGLHGVVPLAVCIAIEEKTGKQLKDIFDLFVGTSTGALVVSAALRGIVKDRTNPENLEKERKSKGFGIKAQNILQIYYDRAKDIFGKDAENRLKFEIPILDVNKYPTYDAKGLKTVINDVFGGTGVTKLGKAEKLLSISSYDVSSRKPHFFRSWQEEYQDLEIGDAVMASSSVPTTHPLHNIKGKDYTDGGVFASNPAMYALIDALSLFGREKLVLVSLGTGTPPKAREQEEIPKDTAWWWLRNIFNIFLDGQEESTHQALTTLANTNPNLEYFRFNIDLLKKESNKPDVEALEKDRNLMKKRLDNELKPQFEKMISLL